MTFLFIYTREFLILWHMFIESESSGCCRIQAMTRLIMDDWGQIYPASAGIHLVTISSSGHLFSVP